MVTKDCFISHPQGWCSESLSPREDVRHRQSHHPLPGSQNTKAWPTLPCSGVIVLVDWI